MKLFRYIVPIFFLFLSFVGAAQTEYTRYYDKKWKPTTKDNASYMRKITYGKDGKPKGVVRDYYYDSNNDSIVALQWEGYIVSEDLETGRDVLDGKCVWYDEWGGVEKVSTYKNGVLDGYYFYGKDEIYGCYKNGEKNGWFIDYDTEGVELSFYEDGKILYEVTETGTYKYNEAVYTYHPNGTYQREERYDDGSVGTNFYSADGNSFDDPQTLVLLSDTVKGEYKLMKIEKKNYDGNVSIDTLSYKVYWDKDFKIPRYSYKVVKDPKPIETIYRAYDTAGTLVREEKIFFDGKRKVETIDGDLTVCISYDKNGEEIRKSYYSGHHYNRSSVVEKIGQEWFFTKYDENLITSIKDKYNFPKQRYWPRNNWYGWNGDFGYWTGDYMQQENNTYTGVYYDNANQKICELSILFKKENNKEKREVTITFFEKDNPSKVLTQHRFEGGEWGWFVNGFFSHEVRQNYCNVRGCRYYDFDFDLVPVRLRTTMKNVLYGMMNLDNNVSVEPKYKQIRGTNGGYIICETDKNCELYDIFLTKQAFSAPYIKQAFDGGLVVYSKQKNEVPDRKYGLALVNGKIITPCEFDFVATDLDKGLLWVRKNGKFGAYSKTGKVLIAVEYDKPNFVFATKTSETYNKFKTNFTPLNVVDVMKNGKYGIATANGDAYTRCQFDEMILIDSVTATDSEKDIVALVRVGTLWGAVNRKGRYVISPQYNEVQPFISDVDVEKGKTVRLLQIIASKNGRWGVVSSSNQVLLPFEYDYVSACRYNSMLMMKDSKVYCIGAQELYDGFDKVNVGKYRISSDFHMEENRYPQKYYVGTLMKDYYKSGFIIVCDDNGHQIIPPTYSVYHYGGVWVSPNIKKYMDSEGNSAYVDSEKTLICTLPAGFEIERIFGDYAVVHTNTTKRLLHDGNGVYFGDRNDFYKMGIYHLKEKRLVVDTLYDMVYKPQATDSLFWAKIYPDKEHFEEYKSAHEVGVEDFYFTPYENPYRKNWRLFSYTGKPVNSVEYEYPHKICGTLAKVGGQEHYGVVNMENREILPQKYANVEFTDNGLILFGNKKWGLADRKGKILYQNRWTDVTPFIGNHFVGFTNTSIELVDMHGHIERTIPLNKVLSQEYDLYQYLQGLDSVYAMKALPVEIRNQMLFLYAQSKSLLNNKRIPISRYRDSAKKGIDYLEVENIYADENFLCSSSKWRSFQQSPFIVSFRDQTAHSMTFLTATRGAFDEYGDGICTSLNTYNYVFDKKKFHSVELYELFKKRVDYDGVLSNLIKKQIFEAWGYRVSFDDDFVQKYTEWDESHDDYVNKIPYYDLMKDNFIINKYGITFYLYEHIRDNYAEPWLLVIPFFEIQDYLDYSGPLKYFLEE